MGHMGWIWLLCIWENIEFWTWAKLIKVLHNLKELCEQQPKSRDFTNLQQHLSGLIVEINIWQPSRPGTPHDLHGATNRIAPQCTELYFSLIGSQCILRIGLLIAQHCSGLNFTIYHHFASQWSALHTGKLCTEKLWHITAPACQWKHYARFETVPCKQKNWLQRERWLRDCSE